jgi:hypothetical protein
VALDGLGKDIWNVEVDAITEMLKRYYIIEILYTFEVSFTKISIIYLCWRIFISRSFRIACYVMIAACLIFAIVCLFSVVFQCRPVSYAWTRWDGEHTGTCISANFLILSNSITNIILDLLVFFLPLPQM